MLIPLPTQITEIAWEGALESPSQVESFSKGGGLPRLTLGRPQFWPATQLISTRPGPPWTPPQADHAYTLVQLPFTLHPPTLDPSARYAEARLLIHLLPGQPGGPAVIAHDLHPQREAVMGSRTYKFGLNPSLKFGPVEIGEGSIGVEIETPTAAVAVQAFGLGESRPYWTFQHQDAAPLTGTHAVYLVIAAPVIAQPVRLILDADATIQDRFGLAQVRLPRKAAQNLAFTIA